MPAARVDASGLRRHLADTMQKAADRSFLAMQARLEDKCPIDTSETFQTTQVHRSTGNDATVIRGVAEATTPQARWTDEGTRPHTIRPRARRALRFNVGGRVVYARVVHHPGSTRHVGWFSQTVKEWPRLLAGHVRAAR